MAIMSAPSIQPRFLSICEGTNGHIFNIGRTQAHRYIKKKDMFGYIGCTYSNLTKKLIATLTHKLASIVGPIMTTKQVTDTVTNVETTVDKLYADITYL